MGLEALITSWVGTFGLKAWLFRFANIVGARGTHGVIFDFIHKLKADPPRLRYGQWSPRKIIHGGHRLCPGNGAPNGVYQ
ncbi:MAG: hypothetical protein Ct9H90mP16_18110 [Candidatus Poseidoniales archaeon]|nr:MAG: hypothetical protein Ct9H90mP16_18110 [Candidatus Poseidoniales archaeon]